MKARSQTYTRNGFSILFVVAVLAAVAIISTMVLGLSKSNVRMSGYYRWEQGARYNALAGVEYVKAKIETDLALKNITLSNQNTVVNYPPPNDYQFDPVTNLVRVGNQQAVMFKVRGYEMDSIVEIEAVFKRRELLAEIGLFGDKMFNGQPNAQIFSYRSSSNPTFPLVPGGSTGEAGIGSNEKFEMPAQKMTIDGIIYGGLSELGVPPTQPSGYDYQALGERVEPDPLGIVGGSYAKLMTHFRDPQNNSNQLVSKISNNQLNVAGGEVVQIPAGNYYLTNVDIKGRVEILGTPSEPVHFWLEGPMVTMPQSEIISAGAAPTLRIFSGSTAEITIQPTQPSGQYLLVWVYAPYAPVILQPNNDTYGSAWGSTMTLQPGNRYYIDVDVLEEYRSASLDLVSIKELRY